MLQCTHLSLARVLTCLIRSPALFSGTYYPVEFSIARCSNSSSGLQSTNLVLGRLNAGSTPHHAAAAGRFQHLGTSHWTPFSPYSYPTDVSILHLSLRFPRIHGMSHYNTRTDTVSGEKRGVGRESLSRFISDCAYGMGKLGLAPTCLQSSPLAVQRCSMEASELEMVRVRFE